jgi:hypothetical protein
LEYFLWSWLYYPGAKFNNVQQTSHLLASSLMANTGACGGSLSRIARGPGNLSRFKNDILLMYKR